MPWFLSLLGPIGDLLLKWWNGRKPDPIVIEAEKAGASDAKLQTESQAVAELRQASAARADADAVRLRNDPHGSDVTTDPTAPVNQSPDAHFRD